MNEKYARNKVYTTIGASNHSKSEREENDYYATDPSTIDDLFRLETFSDIILEPACGEGHLSKRMRELGKNVLSYDLIDRGFGVGGYDFLKSGAFYDGEIDIITNPPYKLAQEFVEHALEISKEGTKIAMFLKLTFLEGKKRRKLFDREPPKRVLVYSDRKLCAKNGEFNKMQGRSAIAYAWYIWEKGFKGKPVIEWI